MPRQRDTLTLIVPIDELPAESLTRNVNESLPAKPLSGV
jgi:hypothetical protein